MKLVVDPRDGTARLTIPLRAPAGPALAWAETKRGWVEAQRARRPEGVPITPGMLLPLGDEQLRLDWSERYPRSPKRIGDVLRVGGPADLVDARVLRWLQREALAVLTAETAEFAAIAGVTVTAVGIGDATSRWGSCSTSGGIRYSWRLILAPAFVRRATVAHEVAHRVHMDHSARFHALVETIFGEDPSPARRWLRTHGVALHGFGRAA